MKKQPNTPNDVLRVLIDYIRDSDLKPGDRLPSIREFGEEWNVGRNVTRDAFQRAESLGLIRLHPRAGAFVAEFNYHQLADMMTSLVDVVMHQGKPLLLHIHDVRTMVEREAIRRVAENRTQDDLYALWESLVAMEKSSDREAFVVADDAFHLTIARSSGNPLLSSILETLLAMLRSHKLSLGWSDDHRDDLYYAHRQVYDAILEKDPDRAVECLLGHMMRQRSVIVEPILETQEQR